MCDVNKGVKIAARVAASSKPIVQVPIVQAPVQEQLVCFYGHKVTSSIGPSGKYIWRKAPKILPRDHVLPGRVLCQKCYQAHRIAHESGLSQCIFNDLYVAGHPDFYGSIIADHRCNDNNNNLPTATSFDTELECEICALDCIDELTLYSFHLAWFRLGEKCFKFPSHEKDSLSDSTARPPGA